MARMLTKSGREQEHGYRCCWDMNNHKAEARRSQRRREAVQWRKDEDA